MKSCGTPPRSRIIMRKRSSTATGWKSKSCLSSRKCSSGDSRPRLSFERSSTVLLDNCQHVSGVHRGACADQNLLDSSLLRRFDFVLHLHRFDHEYAGTSLDFVSVAHQHANDLARHGSGKSPG